jgi:hypothetical protein
MNHPEDSWNGTALNSNTIQACSVLPQPADRPAADLYLNLNIQFANNFKGGLIFIKIPDAPVAW